MNRFFLLVIIDRLNKTLIDFSNLIKLFLVLVYIVYISFEVLA